MNLLEGLPWTAGANTTLSIADGLARATRAGANPRIYKHVTGLTIGATYRLLGNGYKRTCTNIVLRAAPDSTISNGDNYDSGLIPNDHAFDVTFVSTRTEQYIGFIGTSTVNGQYCECDEGFQLLLVSEDATGTMAGTDGADAASFSGSVPATGALSGSEGADIASVAGNVIASGSFAASDGADSATGVGLVLVQGSFAPTEGADAIVIDGVVEQIEGSGALAGLEGADTSSFAGLVEVRGSFLVTEGPDDAQMVVGVYARGSMVASDGADDANLVGSVPIAGSLAVTDGADIAAFSDVRPVELSFPSDADFVIKIEAANRNVVMDAGERVVSVLAGVRTI